jgi:hypothetical protein
MRDEVASDSVKDRTGDPKIGMPLLVVDNGFHWGLVKSKQEWIADGRDALNWPGQGRFAIVKIPAVAASKALALMDVQTEDDTGVETGGIFRYRRWVARIDLVPAGVVAALENDGEDSFTVNQIKNYIRRIRDDLVYGGLA